MRSGTIAFLSGIAVFQFLPELPDSRWCLLLPVLVLIALRSRALRPLVFAACGFLWSLLHASLILSTALVPSLEGEDVSIDGVVVSVPRLRDGNCRFEFDVTAMQHEGRSQPPPGRILLSWYRVGCPLGAGEAWRLQVRLKRPHGFMNPGGFDYAGWLYQRHIRATGYVRGEVNVQRRMGRHDGHLVQRFRQQLATAINEALPQGSQRGIITALTVGVRHGIDAEQWAVLVETGTSHLMAISGLHVGLAAMLLFCVTRWLWSRIPPLPLWVAAPRVAALVALAGACGYAAMAGFSIPTQRALVLVAVVMFAVVVRRRGLASHSLSVALLLVLLWDPLAVLSYGFWLSFAAVVVILYGMGGRQAPRGWWWKWGRVQLLIAVGLMPLLLLFFQQVPLLAPVANIVAVPWVGLVVVPTALLGTALLLVIPPLGVWLLQLADLFMSWLWPLLTWLSAVDGLLWRQHAPLPWTLAPAAVGLLWLLLPRGMPGRWVGVLWLLPMLMVVPPAPRPGEVWITMLDVGQGLSVVVRTHGHNLLYDTGPRYSRSFEAGRAVVVPYLRHVGVAQLDLLVLGHGDNDHAGGAPYILEHYDVRRVVSSVAVIAGREGVPLCRAGQQWHWDGVLFEFIHPATNGALSGNDASCVLRVTNSAGSMLLSGDIERAAEQQLLSRFGDSLRAQLLIAPHHGSMTSSTPSFIDAVAPQYVLFATGYRNRYGFPKAAVVERYTARGARPFDSASDGAVTFRFGAAGEPPILETARRSGPRYWHTH